PPPPHVAISREERDLAHAGYETACLTWRLWRRTHEREVNSHRTLEPRNIRKRHGAAMDVDAAEFSAAMQCWEHLAGVEQTLLVEGALEPLLLSQVSLAEHFRHQEPLAKLQ